MTVHVTRRCVIKGHHCIAKITSEEINIAVDDELAVRLIWYPASTTQVFH